MIAYKNRDYAIYFTNEEIEALVSGAQLCVAMTHYCEKEPLVVQLVDMTTIRNMIEQKQREELFFANDAQIATVFMSETDPTEHTLTFETLWFQNAIEHICSEKKESVTIRWGPDKITILTDPSPEAEKFKVLFGP